MKKDVTIFERDTLTRSVLIEKKPFMVSCEVPLDRCNKEYMVRNWEYNNEFYIIVEGTDYGCVLYKELCTRLSKKM